LNTGTLLIIAVLGLGLLALWNFVIRKHVAPKQGQNKAESNLVVLASLRETKTPVKDIKTVGTEIVDPIKPEGKYRAMVWTDAGVVFKSIAERIGLVYYPDPSMPETGEHLFVVEKIIDGKETYTPFDPLEQPIVNEETPEWAYDSTHCYNVVYNWYKNKASLWDKINTILIFVFIAALFFIAIVALGSK
jgi:hypothetical protein